VRKKLNCTNYADYIDTNNILLSIYLENLCADKLKVDRMFIKDYPKYDEGIILKAIVSMAKELSIILIVKGIDTKEHLDFVTELGCEEYQGYYTSKPVPFEEFKGQL
jgi:EAL domain-containing protein (putative c-di-GMP-specific phosphodiesterase class I)